MIEKNRVTIFAKTKFWMVVLLFPVLGFGQEFFPLPKPTHYAAGLPQSKLVVVKEIPLDFNDDVFMAEPTEIAVNKNGQIYIFDKKLLKVFMVNSKGEYVGQFLEKGIGPGETFPQGEFGWKIYAGWNDKFYISDRKNAKIIEFTDSGRYLRDIKTNRTQRFSGTFYPIVDKNGFFYIYSKNGGIIDQMDNQMKLVHTYLQKELNNHHIYCKPDFLKFYSGIKSKKELESSKLKEFFKSQFWLDASTINTTCDITANGLLFIYLHRPSTVYLFNGKNLLRKFDVLIDSVLANYKKTIDIIINVGKKKKSDFFFHTDVPLFLSCVVDYDAPYFYLQAIGQKQFILFQIDFTGKLIRILTFPKELRVTLMAKRNGLFYGIVRNTDEDECYPIIFKSEGK